MYLIKLTNTTGTYYLDLHGRLVTKEFASVFGDEAKDIAANIRNEGEYKGYHVEVEPAG